MPTVRVKSAAARFGNYLYVSGGQKDRHTMNEVIRYCIGICVYSVGVLCIVYVKFMYSSCTVHVQFMYWYSLWGSVFTILYYFNCSEKRVL